MQLLSRRLPAAGPASGAILIAGLGSIGRRHLRSLQALESGRPLHLFRSGQGAPDEPGWADLQVDRELGLALARQPQAVVVANPTALHVPLALQAARAGCHLLIEKPVGHSLEGLADLEAEVERQRLVVLVGYQFRLHPTLQRVKQWLSEGAIGPVVSAQAHWSEALPDWHPHEDYRRGYSARRELGGGALLTLSHPLDYLRWLLGEPISVAAEADRVSQLELDVEDVAHVLLRFESGALGSVQLDYVGRPAQHGLLLVGQAGLIRWNAAHGLAELLRAGGQRTEVERPPAGFGRDQLFLAEMRHFLDCLAGLSRPACSLSEGVATLRLALRALEAARERRTVSL